MTPEVTALLACIAFGAGAVIAGLQKAWALMLIAVGLFLVTVAPLVR